MQIQMAEIVIGTESHSGDGTTGALRCLIRLPDSTKRSAILKRGPIGHIAAELFSALLLKAWGLDVPEPFLINEDGNLAFASADLVYPNLKQSLCLDSIPDGPARDAALQIAITLACEFTTSPLAAACDEAIDNRDRNLGNILWDGSKVAWIDHAYCVGQGTHLDDENKLCAMAIYMKLENRLQRSAIAHALLLQRDSIQQVSLTITEALLKIDQENIAQFISARLTSIGNRLIARFPKTTDLLTGL